MPSLIEDLGAEYVDQFYRRAMFQLGNMIYQYNGSVGDGHISVKCFRKDSSDPRWEMSTLRSEDFPDMDAFSWPRLGYRNLEHGGYPPSPYYLSTSRSAMRGLRAEFLRADPITLLSLLPNTEINRDLFSSAKIAQTIFNPKFIPFSEGMALLRAGDAPGFALSSDVAIAISVTESADTKFEVLHRQRVVGRVTDDDHVVVPKRFFKRTTIATLFDGRIAR